MDILLNFPFDRNYCFYDKSCIYQPSCKCINKQMPYDGYTLFEVPTPFTYDEDLMYCCFCICEDILLWYAVIKHRSDYKAKKNNGFFLSFWVKISHCCDRFSMTSATKMTQFKDCASNTQQNQRLENPYKTNSRMCSKALLSCDIVHLRRKPRIGLSGEYWFCVR